MILLSLLMNHFHYWGIPHRRSSDQHLIQICYECGAEREIKIDLCPVRVPTDADWQDSQMNVAISPEQDDSQLQH
jgi:hypothetical protein